MTRRLLLCLSLADLARATEQSGPDGSMLQVANGRNFSTENNDPDGFNDTNDSIVNTSNATTRPIRESIMQNLTLSFVGEIYDPITFSVRITGESIKKGKVARLGNVVVVGDADRATRALRRQISNSAMILTRDAPETHQYFSAVERARFLEEMEKKKKEDLRRQVREELARDGLLSGDDEENKDDGLLGTPETVKLAESLGTDVALNGVWRNITVVDAWTFDGTHVATSLAKNFPKLFEFSRDPYLLEADIRRAIMLEETEEAVEEPEVNTASSNYHILQARGAIRKDIALKKVSKIMAEIGKGSDQETAAAELLGIKRGHRHGDSVDEEAKNNLIAQYTALALILALGLGVYQDFGRAPKKWKSKPSVGFIEKQKQSLEYKMNPKTNANIVAKPRKERVPEYRESHY